MPRPRYHLLATLPIAAVAARTWGGPAALGALCGGMLIDADHVVDYVWTRARGRKSHYLAPLHAWELLLALGFFARAAVRSERRRRVPDHWVGSQAGGPVHAGAAVLAGVAVGMMGHLAVDVAGNRPRHAGVYSLVFRLRHGFTRESTGWTEEGGFHGWSELPWYQWWRAF
ncbi:MAG TPA: hypothetical protein VFX49_07505 [Chloroflexota bacterium]|nr:hypothetical protein [Chloroflexota bacterium]